VQAAKARAALRLVVDGDRRLDLGATVPTPVPGARLVLAEDGRVLLDECCDLRPGEPWLRTGLRLTGERPAALVFRLLDASGAEVLAYQPPVTDTASRARPVAVEPPSPAETKSNDELYLTGEHLEQYRHPTRAPEAYWQEALRRDPGDARCHLALGKRLLRRGLLAEAAGHLEKSVARLTARHPNPVTGEAHYYLGLVRRWQGRFGDAALLLAKATWNHEWRGAAAYELAALDCRRGDFAGALAQLETARDTNRQNNKARVLRAIALRHLGRAAEARQELAGLLAVDPLDHWARHELALHTGDYATFLELARNDAQTMLDLAFDYADAGRFDAAVALVDWHHRSPVTPVAVPNPLARTPSTHYVLAWLHANRGDALAAEAALGSARRQSPDYFFPSRLHETAVLEWAVAQPGLDPVAHFALGNGHYDLKRHEEAITAWENSVAAGANFATVFRNLGLAGWNVRRDGRGARAAYERALALDPADARLLSEFDQLRRKLNESPVDRLAFLERRRELVARRDDASVELATLYNLTGRPAEALALLTARRFHPWEGGEGRVLRQYTAARLLLGRAALARGDAEAALEQFSLAMQTPENLGEAYHALQAKADVCYWLGRALRAAGREAEAGSQFEASAREAGDFAEMAVTTHSPLSYYRGLALRALGREAEAVQVFASLKDYAAARIGLPAQIDYFATSLPNLLVFEEDLGARRDAENHLLVALAAHGLGDTATAVTHLARAQAFTRAELPAVELARELAGITPPSGGA
jgi:tetratricopeptide (TPR) repeat protein